MDRATSAQLLQDALQLSDKDRRALAVELLASLDGRSDPDWASAWAAELDPRVRQLDEGQASSVPWTEAKARCQARLRARGE